MSSSAAILLQENEGILEITINRPERKNSFVPAMYTAFVDALAAATESKTVKVVVVHGADGNFSTGNDVADFLQNPPKGEGDPVLQFLRAIEKFPKPLICAVDGFAVGVGTTMLFHADLVYATPKARFQMPFVNLGLVPEAGSSYLLPLIVGHCRASELLLLGEAIDAETALRYGIINQIVAPGDLHTFVKQKAQTICSKPYGAILQTKMLLKKPHRAETQRVMREEEELFFHALRSPEAIAMMKAFFERKK